MWLATKLAWAGLGSFITHWGIGIAIIIVCLIGEFASGFVVAYLPILKKPIEWAQKYLLYIAIGTALVLAGEWLGAKDMAGRCTARSDVVKSFVNKGVDAAEKNPGKDKWETAR